MAELTVAAGLANGLLRFAAAKGADREALAARAGIDLAVLEDQDNRVPFERYVTLMRAAKAMTGDPALALHYGATDDLAEISIVGLIGHASETMAKAWGQLNRYGRLVVEFDGVEACRRGGPDAVEERPVLPEKAGIGRKPIARRHSHSTPKRSTTAATSSAVSRRGDNPRVSKASRAVSSSSSMA